MHFDPAKMPIARSGHSADIYGDYMVIFGGIRDVIRELNDLHVYSFTNSTWSTIQEPATSPRLTNKLTNGGFAFSGGANAQSDKKASTMKELTTPNKGDSSKNLQGPRRSTTPNTSQLKVRDTKGVRPKSTANNANKRTAQPSRT